MPGCQNLNLLKLIQDAIEHAIPLTENLADSTGSVPFVRRAEAREPLQVRNRSEQSHSEVFRSAKIVLGDVSHGILEIDDCWIGPDYFVIHDVDLRSTSS